MKYNFFSFIVLIECMVHTYFLIFYFLSNEIDEKGMIRIEMNKKKGNRIENI